MLPAQAAFAALWSGASEFPALRDDPPTIDFDISSKVNFRTVSCCIAAPSEGLGTRLGPSGEPEEFPLFVERIA